MSEKRSSVESQKAPNARLLVGDVRDLAVDEVEDVGDDHDDAGEHEPVDSPRPGAPTLMRTPMSVRTFGWMPSATLAAMIARSGNMQTVPMNPVKVIVCYNWGFSTWKARHSSPWPFTTSRIRSRGCPSSRASTVGATRPATRLRRQGASLRDRVRSYLGAHGLSPRHDALLDEIARLEVIVTDSVMEALALENNLIKQRMPRYNILLRDDKNYPYLQLTTSEAFPRVLVARRVEKDGDFYAGPFLPAKLARRTMALTHRLFGIRSCNEVITGTARGRASSTTSSAASRRAWRGSARRSATAWRWPTRRLLLEGRNDELIETLRDRMVGASRRAYSRRRPSCATRCARCRRCAIGSRRWRPPTRRPRRVRPEGRAERRRDPGLRDARRPRRRARRAGHRSGRACRRRRRRAAGGAAAVLRAARPPAEINAAAGDRGRRRDEGVAVGRAGRRVKILVPQRGDKRALVDLATAQRRAAYRTRFNEITAAHFDALETLRGVLGLPAMPRRIECFDISTIQGSETVASMVVCEDGRMKKSEYEVPHSRRAQREGWRFRGDARGRPAALSQGPRGRRAVSRT